MGSEERAQEALCGLPEATLRAILRSHIKDASIQQDLLAEAPFECMDEITYAVNRAVGEVIKRKLEIDSIMEGSPKAYVIDVRDVSMDDTAAFDEGMYSFVRVNIRYQWAVGASVRESAGLTFNIERDFLLGMSRKEVISIFLEQVVRTMGNPVRPKFIAENVVEEIMNGYGGLF